MGFLTRVSFQASPSLRKIIWPARCYLNLFGTTVVCLVDVYTYPTLWVIPRKLPSFTVQLEKVDVKIRS